MTAINAFAGFTALLFYAIFTWFMFVVSPYLGIGFLLPAVFIVAIGLTKRHQIRHPKPKH